MSKGREEDVRARVCVSYVRARAAEEGARVVEGELVVHGTANAENVEA